jgi:hypothetical protein
MFEYRRGMSALMRFPPERRVELYAESLKQIARSSENNWRQYLLTECLESYTKLDETQTQRFNSLLESEAFKEAKPLMITSYERGKIEALRDTAMTQLDTRFGPLAPSVQLQVDKMTIEQLQVLLKKIVKANNLDELHLEG